MDMFVTKITKMNTKVIPKCHLICQITPNIKDNLNPVLTLKTILLFITPWRLYQQTLLHVNISIMDMHFAHMEIDVYTAMKSFIETHLYQKHLPISN